MASRPPKRLPFTKTAISKLPLPEPGRDRHYFLDSRTAGLTCCVTENGTRTFFVLKKLSGRTLRIRLGRYPELTVEQARKLAIELAADVSRGIDPQAARRAARQEPTLGGLWDHWLQRAQARSKRSWPEDQRQWNQHLKQWRNRRLSTLGQQDVQSLHAKIGRDNGRYSANRVLSLLSSMFNRALDIGWNGPNPCRGVERFTEVKRDRFLKAGELPGFFTSLAAEPCQIMRDFFAVALFTGQRRRAVQTMAWPDVDLDTAVWRVPEPSSKNGQPIYVPLDEAVLIILRRRFESRGRAPWVFPSPLDPATHLREPKHAWDRLCDRAALTGVRMHDLRRTMASYQAMQNVSLTIIGAALGHKSHAATLGYARVGLDTVRAAVGMSVTAMRQAGGLLPAPEPVPGPRQKAKRKSRAVAKPTSREVADGS